MPTPLAPNIHGSVGLPHEGVLTNGVALPAEGDGYKRLRKDAIRWGNPRLVAAIERAAGAVSQARPHGPPLIVGDLSAQRGGEIPNHRSHRTGRDADLLLFVLAPNGIPVESPGFVRVGRDALAEAESGRYVRLDLERNWLLVKALASDQETSAQWLFVARWVETQLIEYALARGEEDAVVARAAMLLRQPGDSFPHDDHLHLRIGCRADEEVAGCAGGGNRWPWLEPSHRLAVSDEELLLALLEEEAEEPPLTGEAEANAR
jgi:penicillin-insensitive murein endopeptidase